MEVICLHDTAFYALIENVVERLKKESGHQGEKWVSDMDAMRLLGIKSKTTLQEYRDGGKIRFSQPRRKVILYDRGSIDEFLERHARNTF